MKSMTGFAKQTCTLGNRKYTIEIKTLNSKTLDLITKLPATLRSKDLEIRTMLSQLDRGKVELYITEECDSHISATLNSQLLTQRFQQLAALAKELQCEKSAIFETLVTMPDTWEGNSDEELTEEQWKMLAEALKSAVRDVDAFRAEEGAILKQDFIKHIDLIEQKLQAIPAYESERIDTAKSRIQHYFAENAIKEINRDRFEQELIYYLEKLDITEEKIRLAKHINYFRETMEHEEGSGKKLGFIAQEMGREINTTGSKANHVEIQKLVVEMKDELEKIKEQLGNIL